MAVRSTPAARLIRPRSEAGTGADLTHARRLAKVPVVAGTWVPDEAAMQAALRVVLDLPRVPLARPDGGPG